VNFDEGRPVPPVSTGRLTAVVLKPPEVLSSLEVSRGPAQADQTVGSLDPPAAPARPAVGSRPDAHERGVPERCPHPRQLERATKPALGAPPSRRRACRKAPGRKAWPQRVVGCSPDGIVTGACGGSREAASPWPIAHWPHAHLEGLDPRTDSHNRTVLAPPVSIAWTERCVGPCSDDSGDDVAVPRCTS